VRQHFPKGSDLSQHDTDDLVRVESQVNKRPRKSLGWATPEELFTALLSAPSISECCDHP
jgi:IS30 family transposase